MGKFIDRTGDRYGSWVVLERADNDARKCARWLCRCTCGTERVVSAGNLAKGASTNCGCEQRAAHAKRATKHGLSTSRLNVLFRGMKQRCYNPKNPMYRWYGARGVTICDEWVDDFAAFYEWAINHGYEKSLTIDRKDNSKGYSPSNCQWLTRGENTKKAWESRREPGRFCLSVSLGQRRAPLRKDNTSGCKGVTRHKTTGKWHASIGINRKQIFLGSFISKEEAITARKEAEKEYRYHPNHGK